MKVGELIKYLEGFDHELRVMINIPDINLEEVKSAEIEQVVDSGKSKEMCGRYESFSKGMTIKRGYSQPFPVLVINWY